MSLETRAIVETGAAAMLFAAIFLAGSRVHPFRRLIRDCRSIIFVCSGMSAVYVFVHVMLELHDVRTTVVESVSASLRYEGMAI